MILNKIETLQKDPNEKFRFGEKDLDFSVINFWKWNQSNLIENRNRGILAEFIVMQGLEIQLDTRLEWDSFDLITKSGYKIEVKSAAYIQTWNQKTYSFISFNIPHSSTLLENNKYSEEKKRQADIYIFCLLHHKDQSTINPLDLNQWTFYLVATPILDKFLPNQKTIRLSTLEKLRHEKCNYVELKNRFEIVKKHLA